MIEVSISIYKPLAKSLGEFRLLTIKPGPRTSLLECSLTVLPLGDISHHKEGTYDWTSHKSHEDYWELEHASKPISLVPEFESLSYTWGDPKITEPILVNGHVLNITTNLNAALLALRKTNEERVLWVDAICINQADVQERSEQVLRMRDIY